MDTEAADVAPNLDNLHIGDDGSDGNDALLDAVGGYKSLDQHELTVR